MDVYVVYLLKYVGKNVYIGRKFLGVFSDLTVAKEQAIAYNAAKGGKYTKIGYTTVKMDKTILSAQKKYEEIDLGVDNRERMI